MTLSVSPLWSRLTHLKSSRKDGMWNILKTNQPMSSYPPWFHWQVKCVTYPVNLSMLYSGQKTKVCCFQRINQSHNRLRLTFVVWSEVFWLTYFSVVLKKCIWFIWSTLRGKLSKMLNNSETLSLCCHVNHTNTKQRCYHDCSVVHHFLGNH